MTSSHAFKSQTFLILGSILVLITITFYPVLKNLVLTWLHNEDYSHGFLVVPISLYILWTKKDVLSATPLAPSPAGLVITIITLLCYIVSFYAEVATLSCISFVITILGLSIYFFGFGITKAALFPIVFLMFMIPIPSQIYASLTGPLQLLVTKACDLIINALGIPVYTEGNVIHLPGKTFSVVNACSGLRSMLSLIMLSALFGYLSIQSRYVLRFILLGASIPITMFVNIIRVGLMVALAYYSNYSTDATKGTLHTLIGIAEFAIALVMLFVLKEMLLWAAKRTTKKS